MAEITKMIINNKTYTGKQSVRQSETYHTYKTAICVHVGVDLYCLRIKSYAHGKQYIYSKRGLIKKGKSVYSVNSFWDHTRNNKCAERYIINVFIDFKFKT